MRWYLYQVFSDCQWKSYIHQFKSSVPLYFSRQHFRPKSLNSMNNAPIVKNDVWNYRFRLFTAAGIIPALIVMLPYPWNQFELTSIPSICCAPLAMSAALGAVTLTGRKTSPALRIFADLIIAASLLAVIVPKYVFPRDETTTDCRTSSLTDARDSVGTGSFTTQGSLTTPPSS